MVYQPLIKLIFHSLSIIAIILLVTYLICSMINLKVGVKRLTPDYYMHMVIADDNDTRKTENFRPFTSTSFYT